MDPRFLDSNGFTQSHGLSTNTHGRAYKKGSALSFAEKVSIGRYGGVGQQTTISWLETAIQRCGCDLRSHRDLYARKGVRKR